MNKLYKLSQGAVSTIRSNKAGVEEAIKAGYKLDGEVREVAGGYELVSASVSFPEDEAAAVAAKKAAEEKAAKEAREILEKEAADLKLGTKAAIAAMSDIDLAAAVAAKKA